MTPEIRAAFEAVVDENSGVSFVGIRHKSDRAIRREATLFMKQVERLIENLPDPSMTINELYEEIAGEAWKG